MAREELIACQERIFKFIHRTPILRSSLINELTGADIYFKCENFQRMGAFKMRGALNAILQLPYEKRSKGVVTHSSGNFAQAVSLAAKSIGVKAYIVMPSNAPHAKKAGVKTYGGHITECEPSLEARAFESQKIAEESGATFLHPSNDYEVIIGQGTAALELIQDKPSLHSIIAPVGGGGLLAGTALAAYHFGDDIEVFGAEPEEADDACRSLKSGKIQTNISVNTIADGLRTTLGDINFPIISRHVKDILLVSEQEIVEAMRLVWERMKIIIEPSSAVAVAAVIRNRDSFKGQKTGIIISGGNADLSNLPF